MRCPLWHFVNIAGHFVLSIRVLPNTTGDNAGAVLDGLDGITLKSVEFDLHG